MTTGRINQVAILNEGEARLRRELNSRHFVPHVGTNPSGSDFVTKCWVKRARASRAPYQSKANDDTARLFSCAFCDKFPRRRLTCRKLGSTLRLLIASDERLSASCAVTQAHASRTCAKHIN